MLLAPLFLLIPCLGTAAEPPGPPSDTPQASPAERPSPEAAFEAAYNLYLDGNFASAKQAFDGIVQRARLFDDVGFDVEARALLFLGEIAYQTNRPEEAAGYFRQVLERDRDYRPTSLYFAAGVINAFEAERAKLPPETTRVRVAPMPWWGYAPFGTPQYVQKRPVRGAVYTVLQVGFAATSVAAWVVLDGAVPAIPQDVSTTDLAVAQAYRDRVVLYRDLVSFGSAAAFYASWGASMLDAGLTWRAERRAEARVGVMPRPDGVSVQVAVRF